MISWITVHKIVKLWLSLFSACVTSVIQTVWQYHFIQKCMILSKHTFMVLYETNIKNGVPLRLTKWNKNVPWCSTQNLSLHSQFECICVILQYIRYVNYRSLNSLCVSTLSNLCYKSIIIFSILIVFLHKSQSYACASKWLNYRKITVLRIWNILVHQMSL
jgi:hypothetical protein